MSELSSFLSSEDNQFTNLTRGWNFHVVYDNYAIHTLVVVTFKTVIASAKFRVTQFKNSQAFQCRLLRNIKASTVPTWTQHQFGIIKNKNTVLLQHYTSRLFLQPCNGKCIFIFSA